MIGVKRYGMPSQAPGIEWKLLLSANAGRLRYNRDKLEGKYETQCIYAACITQLYCLSSTIALAISIENSRLLLSW